MTVLIDSDVLIEVSCSRDAGIRTAWDRLRNSDAVLMCSPVTVAELWHGVRAEDHDLDGCVPPNTEARRGGHPYRAGFEHGHDDDFDRDRRVVGKGGGRRGKSTEDAE
jgi:hypothetical protein